MTTTSIEAVERVRPEVIARLESLAYQRENNAVVSLTLGDCKALRSAIAALNSEPKLGGGV